MSESKIRWRRVFQASFIIFLLLSLPTYLLVKSQIRLIGYRLTQSSWCYGFNTETMIYEIKPYCEQQLRLDDRLVLMTTDRFGFRPVDPLKKKYRVLVLGGSILAGFGLSDDQLRPVNALAKRAAAKFPDVDWINASVQGYTTTHLAIRYRSLIDQFEPNLVVIDSLHGPHLLSDTALFNQIDFNAAGEPRALRIRNELYSNPWKLLRRLGVSVSVLNDLLTCKETFAAARKIDELPTRRERQEAWIKSTMFLLNYMKRISADRGIRFLVLLDGTDADQSIVVNEDVTKAVATMAMMLLPRDQKFPVSDIASELGRNAVPYARLSEGFRTAISTRSEFRLSDKYHLSEKGSELFSDYAFAALEPELNQIATQKRHH